MADCRAALCVLSLWRGRAVAVVVGILWGCPCRHCMGGTREKRESVWEDLPAKTASSRLQSWINLQSPSRIKDKKKRPLSSTWRITSIVYCQSTYYHTQSELKQRHALSLPKPNLCQSQADRSRLLQTMGPFLRIVAVALAMHAHNASHYQRCWRASLPPHPTTWAKITWSIALHMLSQ